jgi:uncharacterized repeat protein (TIGR04138 family)
MIHPTVRNTILTEILQTGRDKRYALDAYLFVLDGIADYREKIGEIRHYTGQELSRSLIEFAAHRFGPLAETVVTRWGIGSTRDFGYIVYNLIDIGLLSKQPDDALEDFFSDFDIKTFFRSKDYYQIDTLAIRSR